MNKHSGQIDVIEREILRLTDVDNEIITKHKKSLDGFRVYLEDKTDSIYEDLCNKADEFEESKKSITKELSNVKSEILQAPAMKQMLEGIESDPGLPQGLEPEIPALDIVEQKLPEVHVNLKPLEAEFIHSISLYDIAEQMLQAHISDAINTLTTEGYVIDFRQIWYAAGAIRATLEAGRIRRREVWNRIA